MNKDPNEFIKKCGKFTEQALEEIRLDMPMYYKLIIAAMEAYGKDQYNQAIEDAVKSVEIEIQTHSLGDEDYDVYKINKQSILKLKK